MGDAQEKSGRQSRRLREIWLAAGPFLPLYYAIRVHAYWDLCRRCRRERALVLTYDDGPGSDLTEPLIELLAAYQAKATFFLLGAQAEQHPELVDHLQRAGHDIGVHSYRHLHPWEVPGAEALADINQGYSALGHWAGPDSLFRPPNGKLSWTTWKALRKQKSPLCWWTLDSGDTWPALPAVSRVVDAVTHESGGVVLMHDSHRDPDRATFVLEATRGLLETANRNGLNVMPLSALLFSH